MRFSFIISSLGAAVASSSVGDLFDKTFPSSKEFKNTIKKAKAGSVSDLPKDTYVVADYRRVNSAPAATDSATTLPVLDYHDTQLLDDTEKYDESITALKAAFDAPKELTAMEKILQLVASELSSEERKELAQTLASDESPVDEQTLIEDLASLSSLTEEEKARLEQLVPLIRRDSLETEELKETELDEGNDTIEEPLTPEEKLRLEQLVPLVGRNDEEVIFEPSLFEESEEPVPESAHSEKPAEEEVVFEPSLFEEPAVAEPTLIETREEVFFEPSLFEESAVIEPTVVHKPAEEEFVYEPALFEEHASEPVAQPALVQAEEQIYFEPSLFHAEPTQETVVEPTVVAEPSALSEPPVFEPIFEHASSVASDDSELSSSSSLRGSKDRVGVMFFVEGPKAIKQFGDAINALIALLGAH